MTRSSSAPTTSPSSPQSFEFGGRTYSYTGELEEFTELKVEPEGTTISFGGLVAMTNGAVLEALDE